MKNVATLAIPVIGVLMITVPFMVGLILTTLGMLLAIIGVLMIVQWVRKMLEQPDKEQTEEVEKDELASTQAFTTADALKKIESDFEKGKT